MSISVWIEGVCGIERRQLQRALIDGAGCTYEPDWRDLYHLRYEGLLLTLGPARPEPYHISWNGFDPLAGLVPDAMISVDIPKTGDTIHTDAAIVRLAAWAVVNLPGVWVQRYDFGTVLMVHARGETVLFKRNDWIRGDRTDLLDAMPLHHRWGEQTKNCVCTWDPSGQRRDYARLADLLRAARADAVAAREPVPPIALAADVEHAERVAASLGVPLPEDYAVALSLSDGLDWDGLVLFDSGARTDDGPTSLGMATLMHREGGGLDDVLVLGDTGLDLLCAAADGTATSRDRVTGEVAERHPSVLAMLEGALAARLG